MTRVATILQQMVNQHFAQTGVLQFAADDLYELAWESGLFSREELRYARRLCDKADFFRPSPVSVSEWGAI